MSSMKFYIVSIVSIFTALGIGMYIGFSMDTQSFVLDQTENLTSILEEQFEILRNESDNIKEENEKLKLELEDNYRDEYIELSYDFIIDNRLNDLKVGIIETNSDYATSSIGKDLKSAGADVKNLTTLNKSIIDEGDLEDTIKKITNSILIGSGDSEFKELKNKGYIEYLGDYSEPLDYLIISGGSFEESIERVNNIDKIIIDLGKKNNIPILGIEKSNVLYSYMDSYKDFGISTVDNIDMTVGKIAMILAMEAYPGNYGIKPSAESILPINQEVLVK